MKILVVDDSRAMRSIVMRTLRQAGFGEHTFAEATNGLEALTQIRSARPDLVLADWNMPEMSGIELLQRLRAEGIPVRLGFVTSEVTAEVKKMAGESGALFIISKPFTVEVMQQALRSVVS